MKIQWWHLPIPATLYVSSTLNHPRADWFIFAVAMTALLWLSLAASNRAERIARSSRVDILQKQINELGDQVHNVGDEVIQTRRIVVQLQGTLQELKSRYEKAAVGAVFGRQ